MKFYDFSAKKMNGQEVKMEAFKGKVVLVVNTIYWIRTIK